MALTLSPRGLLIAIEGIDGAGKTTQAKNLAKQLRSLGVEVVESKEPTNGPWGQQLRQSAETGRLSPERELELFVQDRRDHVRSLIEPSLAEGKVVIVDRYYFSTAAYQGARGMDFADILRLNESFAPEPDLLFILQVEPAVGRARIASRGDRANLFEEESALAASAAIFDRIERPYARKIDGARSIADIESILLYATWCAIEERMPRPATPGPKLSAHELVLEANRLIDDESVPDSAKAETLLKRLGIVPAT